jgi:hypothetical protein
MEQPTAVVEVVDQVEPIMVVMVVQELLLSNTPMPIQSAEVLD